MSFHLFKSSTNKITGESKFLFSGFIFNLFSSLIIGLSVGLLVLAFNNPTGNPTTGGGIIGVGSGAPAGSLYINSSGNVGIGTTDPGTYKLKVIGTAQMTGFQLGTSATAGHILTADTSGVGTWQVAPAGGITSLNGLTGATQTFTNDTNVAITSAGTAHTLGWTGTLAEARIGAGAISQTKLKTAIGEVSASGTLEYPQTLPGGEYGFWPQLKGGTAVTQYMAGILISGNSLQPLTTSYVTTLSMRADGGATIYARQRYVTASGEDMWIFLLVDKNTKEIIGAYQAPDHPAYGNGGDFDKVPHPFVGYDSNTQEIILIEKDQAKAIQQEAKEKNKSVLELIDSEYKINFTQTYDYKPIHSGQFLETQPVLVEHIPDYIQVRKFVEMTDADKQAKKALQEEKQHQSEQEKQLEEQKHRDAVSKLKNLGLTEDDLKAIIK